MVRAAGLVPAVGGSNPSLTAFDRVAQLVRASRTKREGSRFEAWRDHFWKLIRTLSGICDTLVDMVVGCRTGTSCENGSIVAQRL